MLKKFMKSILKPGQKVGPYRVTQNRADFMLATPHKVWSFCTEGTPYKNLIGPLKFCQILHDKNLIELVYVLEPKQENLRCIRKDLKHWQSALSPHI